jgi:hypothetical protein
MAASWFLPARGSRLASNGGSTMSSARRALGIGVILGLAAGLLVGGGLVAPGPATAAGPSAAPTPQVSGAASGAAGALPARTGGGTAAIAYPCFAAAPGIAPDHTIVVTGVGQTDMASDGSDRAAAEQRALDAALADAKGQATAVATAAGLTIGSILSVSAALSPEYDVLPLAGSASGSAAATPVPAVRGAAGSQVPVTTLPAPAVPSIYPQTLSASVTVEYGIR